MLTLLFHYISGAHVVPHSVLLLCYSICTVVVVEVYGGTPVHLKLLRDLSTADMTVVSCSLHVAETECP